MSTPPTQRRRLASDPAPASQAEESQLRPIRRPPLAKRLPGMSDERLLSLQHAATRIARDAEHPKHATATIALPLIDAEIGRRAAGLADRKDERPVAADAAGDNAGD